MSTERRPPGNPSEGTVPSAPDVAVVTILDGAAPSAPGVGDANPAAADLSNAPPGVQPTVGHLSTVAKLANGRVGQLSNPDVLSMIVGGRRSIDAGLAVGPPT